MMLAATRLLAVVMLAAVATAGHAPAGGSSSAHGRELLQRATADCTRIHRACRSCRAQRMPGTRTTALVCSVCQPGWRLRRDGLYRTCDCAPGLALNGSASSASSWCAACPKGKFCPGGDSNNPASEARDCPAGLATVSAGSKSDAQCFTTPGFGRLMVRVEDGGIALAAQRCPVSTYNVGRNTAGCQRCNPGLTTVGEGGATVADCVAPPGSYFDRGVGRKCQRGTFSEGFTNATTPCTPCSQGVTTADEGSAGAAACSYAKRGYYMAAPGVAQLCPADAYSDADGPNASCTPCPFGWRTLDEGADGLALCLAPPGFELKPNATTVSECAGGSYKEGWNRNACVSCGLGLVTPTPGAFSRDMCLVPAGWGLLSFFPPVARMCANGTYGDDVDRPVVSTSRCASCSPNMFTLDMLSGVAHGAGYTSDADCLVAPGWGTTSTQVVERCRVGSYNAGRNRLQCQRCPQGFTTLQEGATSPSACVVQPGWVVDANATLPRPCDRGTYSVGGSTESPGGVCVPCGPGLTTQEDTATSSAECNVCLPGHGGAGCASCTYNTWSSGGLAEGDACQLCAGGTVSARRSTDPDSCYAAMQDPRRDVFALSDEAAWQAVPTARSSSACSFECANDPTCIMYRWGSVNGSFICQELQDAVNSTGGSLLAFKLPPSGMDYALWTLPAGLTAGTLLMDAGQASLPDCMERCSISVTCEAITFPADGSSSGWCRLWASQLDVDWSGMFHVTGASLYADRTLA